MKTPSRPHWKETRGTYIRKMMAAFRASIINESLPSSFVRLSWLEDRDEQLNKLFDVLQRLGVPMGASDWAQRAVLLIERMASSERASGVFVNSDHSDRALGIFVHAFERHRKLYQIQLPQSVQECGWCGWPGRSIGDGDAACLDCLPE